MVEEAPKNTFNLYLIITTLSFFFDFCLLLFNLPSLPACCLHWCLRLDTCLDWEILA